MKTNKRMNETVAAYALKIGASPLDLVLAGYSSGASPESTVRSLSDEQIAASLPPAARWTSRGYLVPR